MKLTIEEEAELKRLATDLGVKVDSLRALIQFESGWNPKAKNPKSSARGLLQFMDKTAKAMGYKSSLDLVNQHPTIISQLKTPVRNYLMPFRPFPTDQSLFMAVFYPVARNWPLEKNFPDTVKKANPGINSPKDYLAYVKRKTEKFLPPAEIGLASLVIIFLVSKAIFRG